MVENFDCSASVSEGTAEFSLAVTPELFHGAGALHGALYFFAMDNAAMLAANSYVTDVCVVTQDFTTHFLKPVSDGRVKAMARVIDGDAKRFHTKAVLYDSKNREIGRGDGIFVRSRYPLSKIAGCS